ncbi:hypothetical protein PENSPDRAFT_663810 [Peniophora sp. CONT]|nr:hypothetical protein PENSPDRAFT_663810 [Peniophora sp. CONT]
MAEDGQPPIQLNLASKGTVGVGGSDPPRHRGNLGGPPETLDESRFSPLANGQQATAALAQQAAAAGPSTSQQAVAGSSEEGGGGRKDGGKGKGKGPDDTWERFTFEELMDRNVGAEMALEVNAMSNEEQIEWWEMWKKVTQRFQMEVTPQPDDQTLLDEEEARTARLERAAAQAAQIEAVLERQQREKRAERERVAETGREHTRSGIGHTSDAAQRQATAFLAGIGPGATATPQIAAPTPKGKTLPHICYTVDGGVDVSSFCGVVVPSEYAVLHNDRRYIPLHLFTDTAIAIFEANKNALLPKSLSNVTGEEMRFIDTNNALFGNELSMNALDIHDALPRWEAWAAEIQPSGLPRLSPAQIARWIREWRVMGKGRDFQKEREYLTACHEVFIIRKKQWLRLPFRLDEAQLKEEVERVHSGIERRAMDSMRAEMVNLKRAYDLRDYGRQNSQGGPARSHFEDEVGAGRMSGPWTEAEMEKIMKGRYYAASPVFIVESRDEEGKLKQRIVRNVSAEGVQGPEERPSCQTLVALLR